MFVLGIWVMIFVNAVSCPFVLASRKDLFEGMGSRPLSLRVTICFF